MAKSDWTELVAGKEINTGENSQLRTSLVETTDGSITGVVNMRKWAKYCTAVDKAAGMTKETVPFRPTTDGMGFPASIIPQVIANLQKIYDFAMKNEMATYDPTTPPAVDKTAKVKTPAPPKPTRIKVI